MKSDLNNYANVCECLKAWIRLKIRISPIYYSGDIFKSM